MRYKVREVNGKYYVHDTHKPENDPEECDSLDEAIAKAASKSFDLGEQSGNRHPEAE
jgi:hypothetical protein